MKCSAASVVVVGILACATVTQAQEVAARELVPPPRVNSNGAVVPERECFIEEYDGTLTNRDRGNLSVEIVRVDPPTFAWGDSVRVTLRLKNIGDRATQVPWKDDLSSLSTQQDPKHNEHFELAFGTRFHVDNAYTDIGDDVYLYAADEQPSSFLILLPGEWATLSYAVEVKCKRDYCQQPHASSSPSITVDALQWLETFVDKGGHCHQAAGHFTLRRLESKPLLVKYAQAAK